ncbi:MAG TPA: FKBP-type peptidyl-prolyl cis-trans isomerase [Lacunisphaera sp.]|nr:FKBP-type peptidyl-prolyl cis-trans isomerase [Lacunisphaera sp.]
MITPRLVRIAVSLSLPWAATLGLAAGPSAAGAPAPGPAPAAPANPPEPELPLAAFAAIGSSFARTNRLGELGWSEAQIAAFVDGIRAEFRGQGYPFDDTAQRVSAEMGRRLREIEARVAREHEEAFATPERLEQYMKETARRLHLMRADSGLAFGIIAPGGGNRPDPADTVVVSFVVRASDLKTDLPQLGADHLRIKVSDLVPGLAEGIQMMAVGGQALLVLPPALSFGQGAWPDGVDRAPLVFKLTLHEVLSNAAKP